MSYHGSISCYIISCDHVCIKLIFLIISIPQTTFTKSCPSSYAIQHTMHYHTLPIVTRNIRRSITLRLHLPLQTAPTSLHALPTPNHPPLPLPNRRKTIRSLQRPQRLRPLLRPRPRRTQIPTLHPTGEGYDRSIDQERTEVERTD
jgi:hypothetical protein